MKSKKATKAIRDAVAFFEHGYEVHARKASQDLKDFGFKSREYTNSPKLTEAGVSLTELTVIDEDLKIIGLKWFAGQIIDIIDNRRLDLINYIINMTDTYAPKEWI